MENIQEKTDVINLMSMNSFIEFMLKKNLSGSKKLQIINNYRNFLDSFDYSNIWLIDNNGNFLFHKYGMKHQDIGYYEFDGTTYGKFIAVSDEVVSKAKSKILLTGNINITHEGKVYNDSNGFYRRLTIDNVYGLCPKKVDELIRYNLSLTDQCLKLLGLNN